MRTAILQVASIEVLHIEESKIVWLLVLVITVGKQLSCRDVSLQVRIHIVCHKMVLKFEV